MVNKNKIKMSYFIREQTKISQHLKSNKIILERIILKDNITNKVSRLICNF